MVGGVRRKNGILSGGVAATLAASFQIQSIATSFFHDCSGCSRPALWWLIWSAVAGSFLLDCRHEAGLAPILHPDIVGLQLERVAYPILIACSGLPSAEAIDST
jgi:hypothetical protein